MKEIEVATRKYQGEVYTFILHLPSYIGEKGVLGIELTPYIKIKTPENCFGYSDALDYNEKEKAVYYGWRYCPKWILSKIAGVCNRNFDKWVQKYS